MEYKNIIIILLIIIVILLAGIGVMLLNQTHAKEPVKIKITSDKEQYEGGELSIVLADLNKTPISKEIVNVTITDSKGKKWIVNAIKNKHSNDTQDYHFLQIRNKFFRQLDIAERIAVGICSP